MEATGTIQFTSVPVAGVDNITIDGQTFNFITGPSSGTDIQVQSTISGTVNEIVSHLNSVAAPPVNTATYSSNGAGTLIITHDTAGDTPNGVFSMATTTAGAMVSGGGFLTGGADASGTLEMDFDLFNLSGGDATFEITGPITATGGVVATGPAFNPFTAPSGIKGRTDVTGVANDTITLDFTSANLEEGDTFDVSIPVKVTDSLGVVTIDTVTYTIAIPDPNDDIKNNRFVINSVAGPDAVISTPSSNAPFATARLVDSNGNPITATGQTGTLEIVTDQGTFGIAIDEMDSSEGGVFGDTTATATGRGFSHFFGLNDFFESGSTLKNSAINLGVRADYVNDPSRLAGGELTLSNQPSDPTANPVFTYELGFGSNQLTTRLADLGQTSVSFDSAGTLPPVSTTLSGYATDIISFTALKGATANENVKQEELLFDGFNERIQSIGGVNIDEELANTVIFQNNFSASARLINIISGLFDTLINAF